MPVNLNTAVRSVLYSAASAIGLTYAMPVMAADDPALEEVVVVGTRTAGRNVDESLAPIDVVLPDAIRRSAAVPGEAGAALQALVPSFNLPR